MEWTCIQSPYYCYIFIFIFIFTILYLHNDNICQEYQISHGIKSHWTFLLGHRSNLHCHSSPEQETIPPFLHLQSPPLKLGPPTDFQLYDREKNILFWAFCYWSWSYLFKSDSEKWWYRCCLGSGHPDLLSILLFVLKATWCQHCIGNPHLQCWYLQWNIFEQP